MGVDVVMHIQSVHELTPVAIKQLEYRLCDAFGKQTFWNEPIVEAKWPNPDAEPYVYEVQQLWRYYGPGYERGPIYTIVAVADFLERQGFTVYYGSDSADYPSPFPKEERELLLAHFAKVGQMPYRVDDGKPEVECPNHYMPMYYSGGQGTTIFYDCPACDYTTSIEQ